MECIDKLMQIIAMEEPTNLRNTYVVAKQFHNIIEYQCNPVVLDIVQNMYSSNMDMYLSRCSNLFLTVEYENKEVRVFDWFDKWYNV